MPIIKSSERGDHITTVIFNSEEVAALVLLLEAGQYNIEDDNVARALDVLDELVYGLGVRLDV
jgi:hypothetical protein